MRSAVHFGAGALGRGLVVPELVAAGWAVTVVDPVAPLVEALDRAGGYDIVVVDDGQERRVPVGIERALDARRDAEAVVAALGDALLVTTAVRKENLGGVVSQIASAWRTHGRRAEVTIVGCENVEHVDRLLLAHFAEAGLSEAALAGVTIPPSVVDRICASNWPEGLDIKTEAYTELAVEPPAGWSAPPGFGVVPDIAAAFDRKRYLVNTLADASAILGIGKGYETLAQAMRDPAIAEEVAPLIASLIRHLELRHGLAAEALRLYAGLSEKRLANLGIPRRIETVARDIWRKMQPGERFMAPLIDLAARGTLDPAAIDAVARLVVAGAAIEGAMRSRQAVAERLAGLAGDAPASRAVYEAVAVRIRR